MFLHAIKVTYVIHLVLTLPFVTWSKLVTLQPFVNISHCNRKTVFLSILRFVCTYYLARLSNQELNFWIRLLT